MTEKETIKSLKLQLRLARAKLRALVDAADGVVVHWSKGDLAFSVNWLESEANFVREFLRSK